MKPVVSRNWGHQEVGINGVVRAAVRVAGVPAESVTTSDDTFRMGEEVSVTDHRAAPPMVSAVTVPGCR